MTFFSDLKTKLHEQAHVASAHLYIHHIIVPSIERLAIEEHVDSKHEIMNMIRRREHLRNHFNDVRFRKKISDMLNLPGVSFALTQFKIHLEASDEKIMNSVPWWMDRLKESNPILHNAIEGESGGRLWFGEVLVDLVTLLREYI